MTERNTVAVFGLDGDLIKRWGSNSSVYIDMPGGMGDANVNLKGSRQALIEFMHCIDLAGNQ